MTKAPGAGVAQPRPSEECGGGWRPPPPLPRGPRELPLAGPPGPGKGAVGSLCLCGLPNDKFCMLNLKQGPLTSARTRARPASWVPMSICSVFSSSTAGVPFNSDLLYGHGEGSGPAAAGSGSGVKGQADEVAAGELAAWDARVADKRLKELDLHGNKRPTSRSSGRRVPSYDKAPFDRDRDELRPLANSLVAAKPSSLRANGVVKNSLLRADQILNQRANGSAGREEELVAMGTLWGPGQLPIRGSSTGTTTTSSSSGKSSSGLGPPLGPSAPAAGVLASFSSSLAYSSASPGVAPARRPNNLSTSTSTRQLLHQNSTASSSWSGSGPMGNIIRSSSNGGKEVEPKYGDPLSGAPASFQQRLMELAALEAETVRWERSKKVKKKQSKQDRDS